jgi:hypothetical protein
MRSKTCALVASLVASAGLGGLLSGCSQPDNPPPVTAAPPPAPTAKETEVPKKTSGGENYGASSKYQKAFEKLNKVGQ